MATDNTTKKDNSITPLSSALVSRFGILERELDMEFSLAGLCRLNRALQRFEDNRKRWLNTQLDPVLHMHLAFTVFVPGGRADKARRAVEVLHVQGRFNGLFPITTVTPHSIRAYVRFPAQKAERLTRDEIIMYGYMIPGTLKHAVNGTVPMTTKALHGFIMQHFEGMGPKAAAHFMRNTGLSTGWDAIPIIDRHILKFLGMPVGSLTPGAYRRMSDLFLQKARQVNIPPLMLDAALWCAYAKNWNTGDSDFDNFEPLWSPHGIRTATVNH